MSVFHKVQGIYDDALLLREELSRIPPRCDCGDAGAHLSGKCCCVESHSSQQTGGCLSHLQELKQKIDWFKEAMHREIRDLHSGELDREAEGRLALIVNLVDDFDSSVRRIREDLESFQETCAHAALERMKTGADELGRHLEKLNQLL